MPNRVMFAGLTGKGHQRIALNSTATALNSTGKACDNLLIGVEGAGARMRLDWTNSTTVPTANTGILLTTTVGLYMISGINANTVKFIRNAAGAVLQVAQLNTISSNRTA